MSKRRANDDESSDDYKAKKPREKTFDDDLDELIGMAKVDIHEGRWQPPTAEEKERRAHARRTTGKMFKRIRQVPKIVEPDASTPKENARKEAHV